MYLEVQTFSKHWSLTNLGGWNHLTLSFICTKKTWFVLLISLHVTPGLLCFYVTGLLSSSSFFVLKKNWRVDASENWSLLFYIKKWWMLANWLTNLFSPQMTSFPLEQQVIPRWNEHWTSNKVYDGDMIVLQGQEKVFLSKSKEGSADVNKEYTKITFTPTQADRLVLAFRNWLRRHGNSQPEWFGVPNLQSLPSTVLSKRQVPEINYWHDTWLGVYFKALWRNLFSMQ